MGAQFQALAGIRPDHFAPELFQFLIASTCQVPRYWYHRPWCFKNKCMGCVGRSIDLTGKMFKAVINGAGDGHEYNFEWYLSN